MTAEIYALAVIAFLIGLALAMYRKRRRTPQEPEFDGGFRHQHPRVTTIIYSKNVLHKDTL